MSWFYNSFRPIVKTSAGRHAAQTFDLPRFIDGSCRREPDFESPFPSITGLCRKSKFAPRLHVDDTAIYVTTKGWWGDLQKPHRRLVAVLQIQERFDDHPDAAQWYEAHELSLPSNCCVPGNPPVAYEQTAQDAPIETWDRDYRARARRYPTFLVTVPRFCDVFDPPIVTDQMLMDAFGREPGTQNPPRISEQDALDLLRLAGVNLDENRMDSEGRPRITETPPLGHANVQLWQ